MMRDARRSVAQSRASPAAGAPPSAATARPANHLVPLNLDVTAGRNRPSFAEAPWAGAAVQVRVVDVARAPSADRSQSRQTPANLRKSGNPEKSGNPGKAGSRRRARSVITRDIEIGRAHV